MNLGEITKVACGIVAIGAALYMTNLPKPELQQPEPVSSSYRTLPEYVDCEAVVDTTRFQADYMNR